MIDWQQRYEMANRLANDLLNDRQRIADELKQRGLYLQPDCTVKTEEEMGHGQAANRD